MKRINILTAGLITILFGACSDSFLDTTPITEKTDGNYYTDPSEAEEALAGCYDALQLIYSDGIAFPVASDVMSDLCFGGTGAGDDDKYPMVDEFDRDVSTSNLNLYEPNWQNYYKGIFRCNTLLAKLDQVNWDKEEESRYPIEAETRFLRAYFYFDMARLWEKVPLLTEPTAANVPQSGPDEIYELIAEDLLFAIGNARDLPYGQIAPADYGHATKWAAEAMLARVYLYYTGYYGKESLGGLVTGADALAFLEDVIANSGHELLDNFADLWPAASTYEAAKAGLPIYENSYAGETNKEVLFAIKYTYTSDYDGNTDGNHWLVMNGLRKMNWPESGYGYGWGANTVLPEVYTGWDPADSRREASVMAIEEEGINYTEIRDVKEYTGYFTKKYIPLCDTAENSTAVELGGVNFMIGQYQDYTVIRYADVLLMAAELGSANALAYVNMVHERAGLVPLGSVDRDVIYEERRLELAFEGIRYWDLLRYDHTLQYAADKLSWSGTVSTGGVETDKSVDGNKLIGTRGLSQIPYNQITLSGGVLEQNPGW